MITIVSHISKSGNQNMYPIYCLNQTCKTTVINSFRVQGMSCLTFFEHLNF